METSHKPPGRSRRGDEADNAFNNEIRLWLILILFLLWAPHLSAQTFRRQANTTLRVPQELSTSAHEVDYTTTDALGGLSFAAPVAMAAAPGENNRLFVLERAGRIIVITNLASPTRTVFLDITDRVNSEYKDRGMEGLSSLAFHPNYAVNRQFFVVYTLTDRLGMHNRLARFETSSSNPNAGLANSEVRLITQHDDGYGHNFNDVHFGPDGYLYLSVGDEGDPNDQYANSQRIDKNFFSGMLRLDVDKRPGSLPPNPHPSSLGNYAIPPDNPFVGASSFNGAAVNPANVRTEFYAVGLRNPWRFSFDPASGSLYCGDVGQHAREEINVIVKGGNYGWSYFEGTRRGFKGDPPSNVNFSPPLYEYSPGYGRTEGTCVIGGIVYRGQRLRSLAGAYIFGDYASGHIWALRHQGTTVNSVQWLTTDPGFAGFFADPRNGDVLFADHEEGKIKRLEARVEQKGTPLPPTLADTGAFADLNSLTPQPGIVPFDVNVPFWSDDARKKRWFSLPNSDQKVGFKRDGNWSFPAGAVWIKHFEIELKKGDPTSTRRLETRFLVRNSGGAYGITYRWDPSSGNASLVPPEGMDESFEITENGQKRTQVWHYPSRQECLVCHTAAAGTALGFNTAQLNRNYDYGGGIVKNQIRALSEAGYFDSAVTDYQALSALAPIQDNSVSLEYRVRSYLAANCSQCHQPAANGGGLFDTRITTPTSLAGLVNGPAVDNGGDSQNRIIRPGSLSHSVLLNRISTLGPGRMPPLASNLLNNDAIQLLSAWILNDGPRFETFSDWQRRIFGSTSSANAAPNADPDNDGASNLLEYLTGTNPLDGSDAWKLQVRKAGNAAQLLFPQVANRGFDVQAASGLNLPINWQSLDVPANHPFFSITNRLGVVEDPIATQSKFYRVRVFEP